MYTLFLLFLTLHLTYSTPQITIYGNVLTNQKFFTNSLPWIVDNVGGDLTMEFYMMGSGRHTIPQMCALEQLRYNNFLKAQYLKCEAEGHPSRYCLCEAGIDAQAFKECVRHGGNYASEASEQYSRLKIDALPLVEVGYKNTVFEVTDEWYLKKICTLFLDIPPLGCVKPFACNVTEVWDSRPGIAQIDSECDQYDKPIPSADTNYSTTSSTTLLPLVPTTTFVSNKK